MDLSLLPALNASLNASATGLLLYGRHLAKRGAVDAHRRVMIVAFGLSALFLASYVGHKIWRNFENTPFHAEGAAKIGYLVLLFSHVVLAAAVPVMAIALIRFGVQDRRDRHRALARFAWPIWMYVSVTGVMIYVLLYHLNPVPAAPMG